MTRLFIVATLLVACKPFARTTSTGFILGPSSEIESLVPSKADPDIREYFKSTVLISTELVDGDRRKFCSGTIIDPAEGEEDPRVLTNFHCFAANNEVGEVDREFMPEACAQTTVYFGFSKDQAADVQFAHCSEGTLIGDYTGDLAVFSIPKDDVPAQAKPLEIYAEPEVPTEIETVVLHHPDLDDSFSKVGDTSETLPTASVTEKDCATGGDFPTDEWELDHTLPYSLKTSCDIVHGSSGSALIGRATDGEFAKFSGLVLGVLWGGIEIKYGDRKKKFNAATKGFYVTAFLNGDLAQIKERSDKLARDASLKREQKQQSSGEKVGSNLNERLCGMVGNQPGPTSGFLLFLILGVPLLLARQRSSLTSKQA